MKFLHVVRLQVNCLLHQIINSSVIFIARSTDSIHPSVNTSSIYSPCSTQLMHRIPHGPVRIFLQQFLSARISICFCFICINARTKTLLYKHFSTLTSHFSMQCVFCFEKQQLHPFPIFFLHVWFVFPGLPQHGSGADIHPYTPLSSSYPLSLSPRPQNQFGPYPPVCARPASSPSLIRCDCHAPDLIPCFRNAFDCPNPGLIPESLSHSLLIPSSYIFEDLLISSYAAREHNESV